VRKDRDPAAMTIRSMASKANRARLASAGLIPSCRANSLEDRFLFSARHAHTRCWRNTPPSAYAGVVSFPTGPQVSPAGASLRRLGPEFSPTTALALIRPSMDCLLNRTPPHLSPSVPAHDRHAGQCLGRMLLSCRTAATTPSIAMMEWRGHQRDISDPHRRDHLEKIMK